MGGGGGVLTGCVNCYIKLLIKSGKIHYSCKNRQIIFAVLLLTFFCLKINKNTRTLGAGDYPAFEFILKVHGKVNFLSTIKSL